MKWFADSIVEQAISDGGQVTFDLLSGLVADEKKGTTITRTIFDLYSRNDTGNTAKFLVWGLVLVNIDAVTANAFPDPGVDGDRADWLGRGMLYSTGALADNSRIAHITKDLRSQRIIRAETDSYRLIVEEIGTFAGGAFLNGYVRTLVKLA